MSAIQYSPLTLDHTLHGFVKAARLRRKTCQWRKSNENEGSHSVIPQQDRPRRAQHLAGALASGAPESNNYTIK